MSNKSIFHYECANCGEPVSKEPVSQVPGETAKLVHGLHGWVCAGSCGRGVKVKRTLRKAD